MNEFSKNKLLTANDTIIENIEANYTMCENNEFSDGFVDTYFWCTLVPMVICLALNIMDAIEETFYQANKELSTAEIICNLIFAPIWPIYTLVLMSWALFRSKTNFGKEEENKDELKRLTKISNKAHLIEVCTESSLQPLVQFFIIFSALLPKFYFGLHPWAEVLRKESGSLTKTLKEIQSWEWDFSKTPCFFCLNYLNSFIFCTANFSNFFIFCTANIFKYLYFLHCKYF